MCLPGSASWSEVSSEILICELDEVPALRICKEMIIVLDGFSGLCVSTRVIDELGESVACGS